MSCKITILIDNNPSAENQNLHSEHGLSVYFETDSCKWLYDTGASAKFAENAEILGIDLAEIDFLILSHGHNDHTGGLACFLSKNDRAKIVLSDRILTHKYHSTRYNRRKDISTDTSPLLLHSDRLFRLEESCRITERVAVVFNTVSDFPTPFANQFLEKLSFDLPLEMPDDFKHEIAVAVTSDSGVLLLSACSHNGVMNTIESCRRFTRHSKVNGFVGGTHLVEETDQRDVVALAERLKQEQIPLYSGHCTAKGVMGCFAAEMGENFHPFFSGARYEFD